MDIFSRSSHFLKNIRDRYPVPFASALILILIVSFVGAYVFIVDAEKRYLESATHVKSEDVLRNADDDITSTAEVNGRLIFEPMIVSIILTALVGGFSPIIFKTLKNKDSLPPKQFWRFPSSKISVITSCSSYCEQERSYTGYKSDLLGSAKIAHALYCIYGGEYHPLTCM